MSLTINLTPQPATLAKTLITAPLPPAADEGVDAFGGKSMADLMAEIGFVDGLPRDLSTNPVYMKDFGRDAGVAAPALKIPG